MRNSAIEGHGTALIAVRRVDRPCCLIPSTLEVVGSLSEGDGEQRERGKSNFDQHDRIETGVESKRYFRRQETGAFVVCFRTLLSLLFDIETTFTDVNARRLSKVASLRPRMLFLRGKSLRDLRWIDSGLTGI